MQQNSKSAIKHRRSCPVRSQALPSESDTTAHFPPQAHLRDSEPPPPGNARSFSSSPAGRPTTGSALQVRKARTRIPDLGPSGPMASVKGVVGSHWAYIWLARTPEQKKRKERRTYIIDQLPIVQVALEQNKLTLLQIFEQLRCHMWHRSCSKI